MDLSQLTHHGVVQASPAAGKVAAGEKAHIKVKVNSLANFVGITAVS